MPVVLINIDPTGNPAYDTYDWIAKTGLFWSSENDQLDTFQTELLGGIFLETVYDGASIGFFSHNETGHKSLINSAGIARIFPGDLNSSGGSLQEDSVFGLLLTAGNGGAVQWGSDAERACYGVEFDNPDPDQYAGGLVLTSDTMEAQAGLFNLDSAGGDVVVTGVGFQPDLVLILCNYPNNNTWQNVMTTLGPYGGHWMHFGAASGPGAGEQFVVCQWSDYQIGTKEGFANFTEGAVTVGINDTVITHQAELQSMDADGFTLNQSTAPPDDVQMAYLALREPNGFFQVGIETQGANGPKATTGAGGRPEFAFFATEGKPDGSIYPSMNLSFGGGDGTLQSSAFMGSIDPKMSRFTQSGCLQMATGSALILGQASLDSLDADGFTLDWSSSDGAARKFGWIVGATEEYNLPSVTTLDPTDVTKNSVILHGEVDVGPITPLGTAYYFQYWSLPNDPLFGEFLETTALIPLTTGVNTVETYVPDLFGCSEHGCNFVAYKDGCFFFDGEKFFKTKGCGGFIPQIYRRVIGTS